MKDFINTGFIALLLFCCYSVVAQDTLMPPKRPKVGLVLSGGAAKGIAHIGVLKVLEEAGIVPDYIAGTSMGSIIGGLYAMGYPADSLEKLILEQDWDKVLSDKIPLDQVIIEEKPFFENQLIEVPFEKWKIKVPSGLIYGQQISTLLSELTLPAYEIRDFNKLPVPFCCVGSDIIRGNSVTIDKGALPDAMRASMAIPTVFTPIQRDSFLLVDGGLIHNFPVSEAKAMGADIIIGVYTGARRADETKLSSFTGIITQSVFLLSIQDADAQMPNVNIYIEPDLEAYSASDFKKADSIIVRGERAARLQFEALKALADSLNQIAPPLQIKPLSKIYKTWIDSVQVNGNKQISIQEIIGESGIRAGVFLSPEELAQGINKLYGTNRFEKVEYRLTQEGDKNIVTIYCLEKSPILIKAAISFDSYSQAGVLLNYTYRNFLLPASRLLLTGKVAENYRFNASYLKYINPTQTTSVFANWQISRDKIPILSNGIQREEYSLVNVSFDVGIQKRLGRNAMYGMGVQRESLRFKPRAGSEVPFDRLYYRNFNAYSFFQLNTLDRNIFPRKGSQLFLEIKHLRNNQFNVDNLISSAAPDSIFAFQPYTKVTFHSRHLFQLHRWASVLVNPFIGITFDANNNFGDFFLIGSPETLTRRSLPFNTLKANEIIAQTAFGLDVGYQHFLKSNLLMSVDLNTGFFKRPAALTENFEKPGYISLFGLSTSIGYNSFIGPIRMTFGLPLNSEEEISRDIRVFLTIGHRF